MIRQIFKKFTKKEVETIRKSFNTIKINQYKYPQQNNFLKREIYSHNIVDENNLNKIYNDIILPEANSFNFNRYNNTNDLVLNKTYLEWSLSDNTCDDLVRNNIFQAVICMHETKFDFWTDEKFSGLLKPNQILFFDNQLPVMFYNYNISDLGFFYYSYRFNEEREENYEDEYFIMGSAL